MLKELLGALAQPGIDASLYAQVDGALLLSYEQTQVGHAWKLAGGTRHVRQFPEARLEEQAFVDGLYPGLATLREAPARSGRAMQARAPPIPELQRARDDGR
jgi:hypothetical protein